MREEVPDPNELDPVSQMELDSIIRQHQMFTQGQNGGSRAVVQYKNLSYLNFNAADLSHADFTGSALLEADLSGGNYAGTSFFACDMR
ncbi:MAG TPA: hypothetical protein DEA55_00095, partial [Rhodospirillaceae bacterium]|nr:hypothetical protein [Rhodospirillaceae bacterium]